jgi:hypothetical protein
MAVYSYFVKRRRLTDVEKSCLLGGKEVLCTCPPRQLQRLYCADFQFPNGDTFVLHPKDVDLTSAIALE